MVEWWQAVLIGLAPSLVTAVVALVIQRHQQRHSVQVQAMQVEADRLARREEAARLHLREQAKPLYEFLAVVERDQGRRFLRGVLEGEASRARAWDWVKGSIDRASFDAMWSELVAVDTAPDVRWQDVVKQYMGRLVVIGDVELRDIITKLLMHLAAGKDGAFSESEVSTLILQARSRIADTIVAAGSLSASVEENHAG